MSGVYRSERNTQYATGYANILEVSARCQGGEIGPMECPASYLSFAKATSQAAATGLGSTSPTQSLMSAYGPAQPMDYYQQFAPKIPKGLNV